MSDSMLHSAADGATLPTYAPSDKMHKVLRELMSQLQ